MSYIVVSQKRSGCEYILVIKHMQTNTMLQNFSQVYSGCLWTGLMKRKMWDSFRSADGKKIISFINRHLSSIVLSPKIDACSL